jgi:hypothetical protein
MGRLSSYNQVYWKAEAELMEAKATCTWGDGPDVFLVVNGQAYDLTVQEAKNLRWDLDNAIREVEQLENLAKSGESIYDIG